MAENLAPQNAHNIQSKSEMAGSDLGMCRNLFDRENSTEAPANSRVLVRSNSVASSIFFDEGDGGEIVGTSTTSFPCWAVVFPFPLTPVDRVVVCSLSPSSLCISELVLKSPRLPLDFFWIFTSFCGRI